MLYVVVGGGGGGVAIVRRGFLLAYKVTRSQFTFVAVFFFIDFILLMQIHLGFDGLTFNSSQFASLPVYSLPPFFLQFNQIIKKLIGP